MTFKGFAVQYPEYEVLTPQTKQSFTGNSMLNDMLNETAESGEWRSINSNGVGSGVFQSSQAQSFGGGMGQQPQVLQNTDGRAVSTDQLQQTDAGKAVVDALVNTYGIDAGRFNVVSKGESAQFGNNNSINRRVEFHVNM